MAYTAKDPRPPWHFLYLRKTKSWRWEEGGEGEEEGEGGEKVSLKTHATARGMGKNMTDGIARIFLLDSPYNIPGSSSLCW